MNNKKKLTLDEIKKIEIDILKSFIFLCDTNNLNYSLAYGTLLGAIRHKGFIPWDDDVDVMMPRADFLKLLSIVDTEKSKYPIVSMYNVNDYFSPLAKMYDTNTIVIQKYGQKENHITGVYIDIFIVDGLPEKNQEQFYSVASKLRKKWGRSCRKFFSRHQSRNIITDIVGSIIAIPHKLRGIKYYRDAYDKHCSTYDFYSSKLSAVVLFGESLIQERINSFDLINPIYVEFEELKAKAINNPHLYLQNMYGNYLELPPIENRKSKHPNEVFWK